jgi:hypothetical protein
VGHVLADRKEMNNRNRGLSIDASYQVSVHFAKVSEQKNLIKNSQSETRIACGGHVC